MMAMAAPAWSPRRAPFSDGLGHTLPEFPGGLLQDFFRHVHQQDVPPGGRQHLRDAAPHLSSAYDTDGLTSSMVIPVPSAAVLPQRSMKRQRFATPDAQPGQPAAGIPASIAYRSVVRILAPVAPMGWPNATARRSRSPFRIKPNSRLMAERGRRKTPR